MMDYQINPVVMGGKIKEIFSDGTVKINLNGRLGVIKVPKDIVLDSEGLKAGDKLKFYFSYIRISDGIIEYDDSDMNVEYGMNPTIMGGQLREVNDTAVKIVIMNGKGSVAVPRRWMFTNRELEEGQNCEFYLSPMTKVS